jgi:hypothetical protein
MERKPTLRRLGPSQGWAMEAHSDGSRPYYHRPLQCPWPLCSRDKMPAKAAGWTILRGKAHGPSCMTPTHVHESGGSIAFW